MAATLSSIRGRTTEIDIYLGDPTVPVEERARDEFFTLHYRQHSLTAKVERLAQDAEKEGRALEALVEMCLPVFVKWDLKLGATPEQMDELQTANRAGDTKAVARIEAEIKEHIANQEPIPLTKADLVEFVPASVLVLILEQINASRRPNV